MEDDSEVMASLIRLMTDGAELTDLTDTQLISAAKRARQARKDAEGSAAAELHRRGWTWEKIGTALGVNQSTVYRWASRYR